MRTGKRERRPGRGFTLVELLVVLAVLAILAALLFPIFSRAREMGWKARCLSNLRQIHMAVMMYAADHDDMLPRDITRVSDGPASDPCSRWNPDRRIEAQIFPYIRNTEVFRCPSATTPEVSWDRVHGVCAWSERGYPEFMCTPHDPTRGRPLSYGWNQLLFQSSVELPGGGCADAGVSLAAVAERDDLIVAADSRHPLLDAFTLAFANYPDSSAFYAANVAEYWQEFTGGVRPGPRIVPDRHCRHGSGQNAVFMDGHARWLSYGAFTGPSINRTTDRWFYHGQ